MGECVRKSFAEVEDQLAKERHQFEEKEHTFISSLLKRIGDLEGQVKSQSKKNVDMVDLVASVLYDFEEIRYTDKVITISKKVVEALEKVS